MKIKCLVCKTWLPVMLNSFWRSVAIYVNALVKLFFFLAYFSVELLGFFYWYEEVLHWSLIAYWAPTNLGSSLFSVLFFGVLKARTLKWLPFPSPVDHILSEFSTMTCLSWVALHVMAHSFIELEKAVVPVISLVSFLWLWFSFCLRSDKDKDKRLIGSFLMGETGWGGNWMLF